MRLTVTAMAAAMALAGFAPTMAEAKALVVCTDAGPEGFDPARFVSPATFDATRVIYDRLTEIDPATGLVKPGLAESWEVSEDGLTYTFRIRSGVRFQTTQWFTPSRELNADDVLFSLMRQRDPKNAYFAYAGGMWPYYSSLDLGTLIKSVKKVDAQTVSFTLSRADAAFPADLALDFASVLSKEYADALLKAKTPALLNEKPVGTGPYQVITADPGARTTYKRNAEYWQGPAKIDLLAFAPIPDPKARLAALRDGTCHVSADPGAAVLADVAKTPDLAIAKADRADVAFLAFNTKQPPFGDVRVRKALGMAIDKAAIVAAVYGGAGVAATGLVPPSMAGYDDAAADAAVNIDAAKQMLADAGVTNLALRLLTLKEPRPTNPDPVKVADMIAADLAKVGVTVTVVAADSLGSFLRQSTAEDRDGAVLFGWTSDNGDLGDYLALLASCDAVGTSNRAQWCFRPFDDALARANTGRDQGARNAAFAEAQEILAVHQPVTAIAHTVVSLPHVKAVTGLRADPLGRIVLDGVDIAE